MLSMFLNPIEIVEYRDSSDVVEFVVGWVTDHSKNNYISVYPRHRGRPRDEKTVPRHTIIDRRVLVEGTR